MSHDPNKSMSWNSTHNTLWFDGIPSLEFEYPPLIAVNPKLHHIPSIGVFDALCIVVEGGEDPE